MDDDSQVDVITAPGWVLPQGGTPMGGPGPAQQPLPFDDEADQPIGFALTARARRAVAPDELPALVLVRDRSGDGVSRPSQAGEGRHRAGDEREEPDPSDTRPARARALARAGLDAAVIAERLAVDPLIARAWIGGTHVSHPEASGGKGRAQEAIDEQAETAFGLIRADAAADARGGSLLDPRHAAGVGMLCGLAEIDHHALTVPSPDLDVLTTISSWLRDRFAVEPARIRVVLRIGKDVSGDLVRYRWARALNIDRGQVALTRWAGAPRPDAVHALLRIADPTVAATVAGWCDAMLLRADAERADVAF